MGAGAAGAMAIMARPAKRRAGHPGTPRRGAGGELPASNIWLWGQGRPAQLDSFEERFGLRGAVITGVDIIRGLGLGMGMELIPVEGATGYIDTNFAGKGRAAVEALDAYDIVLVHVEAADEAGHLGDAAEKVKALERIDELIARLDQADLVVGFNIKRFDYAVLGAYTGKDLKALRTFDILEDVYRRLGFRIGLDHLAAETLDRRKSGDGLQALEWFKQGDMEKLTEYCRHDVEITRDLFLYGLEKGHLIYRKKQEDRRVRLPVDWKLEELLLEKP
jgi:hypothetical protein